MGIVNKRNKCRCIAYAVSNKSSRKQQNSRNGQTPRQLVEKQESEDTAQQCQVGSAASVGCGRVEGSTTTARLSVGVLSGLS